MAFTVYDCGQNTVIVKYSLAPRNDPSSLSTTIYYERYTLIDDNGNLKINEGQLIDGLDNGCTPVIGSE